MLRARASVSGLRTDNGRNEETGTDASFENMMMQCTWWHDEMQHASNDNATTANNCMTPGTSVSGRYNTPPLREDLVPRSRMAPEGKEEEEER